MTLNRTWKWFRHPTPDPAVDAVEIAGATGLSYTYVDADVGKYVHRVEHADNGVGFDEYVSNVRGPIAAAGAVFTPEAGRIAPLFGATVAGTPIDAWEISEREQWTRDSELAGETAFHTAAHAAALQTTAVKNGVWTDPATWSNGLPGAGYTVHIPSAYTITYDAFSDTAIDVIMCHGSIIGDRTKDLKLVVDTIHAMGLFDFGNPDDYMPESSVPGRPRVDIQYKRVVAPGSSFRLGLMTMGRVRIHGAPKTAKGDFQNMAAGSTKAMPKTPLDIGGWRVGDKCVILGRSWPGYYDDPFYKGAKRTFGYESIGIGEYDPIENFHGQMMNTHSEVRTIQAINPTTNEITWDAPLTRDHNAIGFRAFKDGTIVQPLPARVMNMSRSVRFSAAPGVDLTDNQQRAHNMFMYCDDVDVRWAEAYNIGRTDTDPSLFIPGPPNGPPAMTAVGVPYYSYGSAVWSDSTRTVNLGNPNNVRGRYPFHMHGMGARLNRNMAVFEGLSVWNGPNDPPGPGWGITQHNSHGVVEHCNVFRVRGAGVVSELGTETGQWGWNTVSHCPGDGAEYFYNARQRNFPNHNGHSGVAFENQARQILYHGPNEFEGCLVGWGNIPQNTVTYDIPRAPDAIHLRHRDPLIQGAAGSGNDDETYGVGQPQIPDLDNLDGCGCQSPFKVEHRNLIMRNDTTAMRAKNWRIAHTEQGPTMANYTWNYKFVHCAFKRAAGTTRPFTDLGTRSGSHSWIDCSIEGWPQISGINNRGTFVDVSTEATFPDAETPPMNSASFPHSALNFVKATNHPDYKFIVDWNLEFNDCVICFSGTITDSMGSAVWPDVWSGEDMPYVPGFTTATTYSPYKVSFVPLEALKRNGCFQTGGNWFMPLWFSHVDRGNGAYFQFRLDLPLLNFPPDLLAKYTVDPVAAKPQLPLIPESINKPRAITVAPANTGLPPKVDGAVVVGNKVRAFEGEWSGKPNDVDWFGYAWKQGATVIAQTREWTPTTADIGVSTVYEVTAHGAYGATTVATAAVLPVAAATQTPETIFGANRIDWFTADMPRIYSHGYDHVLDGNNSAGLDLFRRRVYTWKGGKAGQQFNVYTTLRPTYERRGWKDGSAAVKFNGGVDKRDMLFGDLGAGNDPVHLWAVIERPDEDQSTGPNGDQRFILTLCNQRVSVFMKSVAGDATQDKLWVNSFAPVTFAKGDRAVVYVGINSVGVQFAFNNGALVNDTSGPVTGGNRLFTLGNTFYGVNQGARVKIKALEHIKQETVTAQQRADMYAYFAKYYL